MEKRQLGKTEIKITPIVLGTWAIGGWMWGGTDEQDSISAIQASLDYGINCIDTAAVYGMGLSEQIVGKAIIGRRNQVIIATKCGMRWDTNEGSEPWVQTTADGKQFVIRRNTKPSSIMYECEQSLKRLGIDVIDLYQIHWHDPATPVEEAWRAMVKLKEQGKVRAIGVSNFSLEQLRQAHAIHPVDSLQPPYSLIRRDIEEDLVPFCRENQISILAYSPLERGLLTGKVTMQRQFQKGDHRATHPFFAPEKRKVILEALEKIKPIADRVSASLSQVICNCTINMPGITAAIVGARNGAQAIENAKAAEIKLSDKDRDTIIKALSELHLAKV